LVEDLLDDDSIIDDRKGRIFPERGKEDRDRGYKFHYLERRSQEKLTIRERVRQSHLRVEAKG